ncbi:hypothetical protein Hdeb2414_s0001g00015101 [Helianthus debilis subsp. tardiflorus]
MLYVLELCVTDGANDEMTCVVFNEVAVSLLKIPADELVNKSLSEVYFTFPFTIISC